MDEIDHRFRRYERYDLDKITAHINEQHTVWNAFIRVLQQHGGNSADLDCLINDAESDCRLIEGVAKIVVGKLWEFVEKPFDLGSIDFECPAKEFADRYPRFNLAYFYVCGDQGHEYGWTTTRPKSPCRYQLRQFREPKRYDDIIREYEHAGVRELIEFASRLQTVDLGLASGWGRSRTITAMGAHCPAMAKNGTSYPRFLDYGGVNFGTFDLKQPEIQKSDPSEFFLTRVYSG